MHRRQREAIYVRPRPTDSPTKQSNIEGIVQRAYEINHLLAQHQGLGIDIIPTRRTNRSANSTYGRLLFEHRRK